MIIFFYPKSILFAVTALCFTIFNGMQAPHIR